MEEKKKGNWILTIIFSIISLAFLYPIFMVVMNSFKSKIYINQSVFKFPTSVSYSGWKNYLRGMKLIDLASSGLNSIIITVGSVVAIIILCSMTAWYITRVNDKSSKFIYIMCVCSMIVPFQMVMFTLSKVADTLKMNNPFSIIIVYLGFGAGLAVFMFSGFVKSIPIEIEEAAMMDGCSPVQTFFKIVLPVMKPTYISVAILEAMWVWNDFLLPYLVLDMKKYKTIPIAIQYLKGGYGAVEWDAMMAMLTVAIIPIIIFYLACQKYIIKGVVAGAVKG